MGTCHWTHLFGDDQNCRCYSKSALCHRCQGCTVCLKLRLHGLSSACLPSRHFQQKMQPFVDHDISWSQFWALNRLLYGFIHSIWADHPRPYMENFGLQVVELNLPSLEPWISISWKLFQSYQTSTFVQKAQQNPTHAHISNLIYFNRCKVIIVAWWYRYAICFCCFTHLSCYILKTHLYIWGNYNHLRAIPKWFHSAPLWLSFKSSVFLNLNLVRAWHRHPKNIGLSNC